MNPIVDGLPAFGATAWSVFWLPLAAWTVVALPVYAGLRLARRAHPLVHYHAHAALLLTLPLGLALAAVTDFTFLAAWWPASASQEATASALSAPSFVGLAPAAPSAGWPLLLGLVTLLAGLLAAWRLARLGVHAAALVRFTRRLPAAPTATLQGEVDALARQMRLRRRVRVVAAPEGIAPMTFGWLRPVIVVPASLTRDDERLRLTLFHELVHVRRQDYLLGWIEQLTGVVFFINPVVGLLRRAVARYRELSCDAEVLAAPRVSSKRYAALLYSFATPRPTARRLALSMATAEPELKNRILAMNAYSESPRPFLKPRVIGLTLAALLIGTATFVAACTDVVSPPAETSEVVAAPESAATPGGEVFVEVEQMPELVGGLAALQNDLRYPAIAKMAGIEGRVLIEFVVDEEGRVASTKVVKGIGGGCDEEARRAVSQLTFTPGRQDGQPVKVQMQVPITFKLPAEETSE